MASCLQDMEASHIVVLHRKGHSWSVSRAGRAQITFFKSMLQAAWFPESAAKALCCSWYLRFYNPFALLQ